MKTKTTEIDKAFAELVRVKRKHRPDKSQFTAAVCAQHLGISQRKFSLLENLHRPFYLAEAVKLCQLLGITEIKISQESK